MLHKVGNMESIGKAINERRKALGISRASLAEMCGVSSRTIASMEASKTNSTLALLMKVMDPLGLTLRIRERIEHE